MGMEKPGGPGGQTCDTGTQYLVGGWRALPKNTALRCQKYSRVHTALGLELGREMDNFPCRKRYHLKTFPIFSLFYILLKLFFIWSIIVLNTKNKAKQRRSVRQASGALLKQATNRNRINIAQITHFKLEAGLLWDFAVTIAHG